jgi:predicted PurR-regulated permease PerM
MKAMVSADMSRVERALLVVALLLIIVIAVKMTSYLISLLMMACVITLLALPALNWLKSRGCSDLLSVLIVTLAGCLIVIAVISLTALSFHTLLADLPQYQDELNTRLADMTTLLASVGLEGIMSMLPAFNISTILMAGISGVMGLADGLMFLFFVGVTSFFMLLEAPRLTQRFEQKFGKDSEIVNKLSRMAGYVIDFIVVRTETNFIHGFLFGGFLAIMGVQGALLWGVLTFLLGYIPYFGLVIAAIPAIFFAWLQFGLPGAAAVIVAVCILNLLVENPVFSYLTARKFEIPALVVILSVIIWGWLLGLVGMLFAVPFTLMILLIVETSDELRWINVILGVSRLFEEKCTPDEPKDQR